MYSINNTDTVTIQLKEGKPMYHRREVLLPERSLRLLRGQGEGGSVLIRKTNLEYKRDETDHNK